MAAACASAASTLHIADGTFRIHLNHTDICWFHQSVLLRVQTREGMARVSVNPTDTLATIATKLQEQMPNLGNFKLSRDAAHKGGVPCRALASALAPQHPQVKLPNSRQLESLSES